MLLSELTTLRVGGPIGRLVDVSSAEEIAEAALPLWADDEPWLALGGGSNVVASDEGFDGTVLRLVGRGIEQISVEETSARSAGGEEIRVEGQRVRLLVQAGEPWDALVAEAVDRGLTGIEALSGIPGSAGAAPMQNIGAYGQEVGDALVAVRFLDAQTGGLERIPAADLGLGYRTSVFKRGREGIVCAIELELTDAGGIGTPVAYPQLADALDVSVSDRVSAVDVRRAVLALRRSKGMVLDDADTDSWSAGSFFTNPIVPAAWARSSEAPRWPAGDGRVKLSAAWLIERSGIRRGFRLPGSAAAISSKHTLAITNTGRATSAQVTELARFVTERVRNEFGVDLVPEPVYVGFD